MQGFIWFPPQVELGGCGGRQFIKDGEIAIVGAQTAGEFPYPLDRIQVGTVRWKKVQAQDPAMLVQPRIEGSSVMPACVIDQNNHLTSLSAVTYKPFQKRLECLRVEGLLLLGNQTSVGYAHGTKHTDALSRWRVQHHRIHVFGGYPHGTP